MERYVGLDVSLKQTAICVVNQAGSIVQEGVVDSSGDVRFSAAIRGKADMNHPDLSPSDFTCPKLVRTR